MMRSVLLVALLLTGCAPTLAEIRAESPATATFAGQYDALAVCVLDRLESHGGFWDWLSTVDPRLVDRRGEQRASILGRHLIWGAQGPVIFEVAMAQLTTDAVSVEIRSAKTPLGVRQDFAAHLWPLIDACGRRV